MEVMVDRRAYGSAARKVVECIYPLYRVPQCSTNESANIHAHVAEYASIGLERRAVHSRAVPFGNEVHRWPLCSMLTMVGALARIEAR